MADAGRRTSRLQHGIDRGEALLRRRRAHDERGQGLGGPSGAAPYESLPPDLESENTLTLARLLRCECDLDSGTRKLLARATVKTALKKSKAHEQSVSPGLTKAAARLSAVAAEVSTWSWNRSS